MVSSRSTSPGRPPPTRWLGPPGYQCSVTAAHRPSMPRPSSARLRRTVLTRHRLLLPGPCLDGAGSGLPLSIRQRHTLPRPVVEPGLGAVAATGSLTDTARAQLAAPARHLGAADEFHFVDRPDRRWRIIAASPPDQHHSGQGRVCSREPHRGLAPRPHDMTARGRLLPYRTSKAAARR